MAPVPICAKALLAPSPDTTRQKRKHGKIQLWKILLSLDMVDTPTPLKADSYPSMGVRVSESGGSIKGLQPSGPLTRLMIPARTNSLKRKARRRARLCYASALEGISGAEEWHKI